MPEPLSMWDGILTGLAAMLAGGVLAVLVELAKRHARRGTVRKRAERLTRALSDADGLIREIEAEVRRSRELADKLRADAEAYGNLSDLKKSEVRALDRVLELRLRAEGRRSFWANVGISFAFFAAGVLVSDFLLG